MRIAILGATGMLGHHAARAVLDDGHQLVVLYRDPASLARLADLRYEGRQAELADRVALTRALQGVDGVINAAAPYPSAPRPWREEVISATQQMQAFYHAADDAKVARVVYVGSAIALPRRADGKPADGSERYAGEPASHNPYLQMKWAMDEQALHLAAKGLPVVIGIPAMSFGEHDYGPTTGQLITGIAKRRMTRYVRGERNVVAASDAGRGLLLALLRGAPGQRYLLAGHNTDMDELTALIARLAKVPAPKPAPLALTRALGRAQVWRYRTLGGALPAISDTAIAVMSAGQHLDGSRSLAIGYAPTVSLEDTVERALRWFRAQRMC
ncbi:NAD-dependent epimerase/dehydratase family protein [Piscinibacter sp.]|uniref:NAD-dependent epimerase/dehydratase family protein n=1 Tax=Piscinibacter sp. TaxID=1903157 RepID=UPI002F427271